eukprot:scaffold191_cov273-Chaetoceros_neogracile.AAC.61
MISLLYILSIPGFVSSFSSQNIPKSTSLGFRKIPAWRERSHTSLSAIPSKSEAKKNFIQVKDSALGFITRENDTLEEDFEEFETELTRQNLGFKSLITSEEFIDSLEEMTEEQSISVPAEEKVQTNGLSAVWQARILLMIAAALYGTNFTFVKVLNDNVPVEFGTFLRFALAAVVTMPWLFQRNKSSNEPINAIDSSIEQVSNSEAINAVDSSIELLSNGNGVLLGGLEVGIWNAIGYFSQAVGLETTPASTSAFICSLAVVVVPILDHLTGKKILRREVFGALFAVAGVAFLELDSLVAGGAPSLSSGDLYSLVQPVAFGIGFWRMEHYMRKFPLDAMKMTATQLSTIALSSLGVAALTSKSPMPDFAQLTEWLSDSTVLGALLWTGLITTALTVAMETFALKTLSAAETTMIFSTEPIFGGICASYVLGEQFGVGGFIGSAMVLGGCLYSNLGGKSKAEEEISNI